MDEPFQLLGRDDESLLAQAAALLGGQRDLVANAANLSALLYHGMPELNWVGFYFLKGDVLIVGPFQGKPACVEIPLGRGVCGTAAASRRVQRVVDVHQFEGHIACDADSRSEIVIPLERDGQLLGVLDVDSPRPGRFGDAEERLLRRMAELFLDAVDWPLAPLQC